MGKPLGNGHPLAGIAVKPEVLAAFGQQCRYFNTFGGNPVSMAVGMAVLDVLDNEQLMANAKKVGDYLRMELNKLQARHQLIAAVRGAGLFIGVELVSNLDTLTPATAVAARVVNQMRDRQVLLGTSGEHANILKIRPPLVFSKENADQLVHALDCVLATHS
jgi:4-aminobutyrate aminotransferase-like enzyme